MSPLLPRTLPAGSKPNIKYKPTKHKFYHFAYMYNFSLDLREKYTITGFRKRVLRKIFRSDRTENAKEAVKTAQIFTIYNRHLSSE
jgi:hypothetical protein